MSTLSAAAAPRPFDPGPDPANGPFPTLPGAMQRSQVQELLREVRRALKLSPAVMETLMKIIDLTRPRDWTDPATEPVCYAAQTRLAEELGKSARAVRNDERSLFRIGLIGDRRRANGSRSQHGQCGLVLSDLIARIPQLLAERDRLRAAQSRQEHLVSRRSVLYRRAKVQLMQLQSRQPRDEALAALTDRFLDWPASRVLRSLPLDALEQHLAEARALVDLLDVMIEKTPDSSGRPDAEFRSHIQATMKAPSVDCSASAQTRPAGKPADNPFSGSPPDGGSGREIKCAGGESPRNPSWMENLTPARLYAIASEDMQLYIDGETGRARQPRMMDFTLAALRRLPELGINRSAWSAAVEQMDDVAATLCVLIIDANRFHPTAPVRNPGGALRAMTHRHAAGTLNLVGSLIGLGERCDT